VRMNSTGTRMTSVAMFSRLNTTYRNRTWLRWSRSAKTHSSVSRKLLRVESCDAMIAETR